MTKGSFCISIDLELLWGRKDLDYSSFVNKTKMERKIISRLLSLFDKYQIPATWAVVGKLYENGNTLWSGIDIIKSIKERKIHELASHSYSHEDFKTLSRKKATLEFKKPNGTSFIFPRNNIGHLDLLKKAGFKRYRDKDLSKYELLMPRIPPTNTLKRKNGLVIVPSSMYFVSARGLKRFIPFGLRLFKSKLAINKAIQKKAIFHLWFHPVDFADNTELLFRELELILKYADKKRGQKMLNIKPMNKL